MDFLKLTHDKLNVTEISELVTHESCGAVSVFIGTTRDNFEDKKVVSLEYEAYEAMALKAMKVICDDVREKWNDIKHIAIYHRLGLVKVCEASIVVALSSPHRVESMQAVQHTMDKLKASVPIWKKEIYSQPDKQNNTSQWKENKESNKRRKLDLTYNEESTKSGQKSIHDFTPNHLVQIKADNNEIQRRITSFIAHKRSLLNNINKKDFILKHSGANNEGEFSCARIDAMLSKRKDSKSHLRVHRVTNEYGPLTKIEPLGKEEPNVQTPPLLPASMSERIGNCEKHLSIDGPVPKDIYSRLKAIEDRILELESISPEYAGFWNTTVSAWPSHPQNKVQNVKIEAPVNKIPVQKQKITLDDVNSRIEKLQKHIQKQSKIS